MACAVRERKQRFSLCPTSSASGRALCGRAPASPSCEEDEQGVTRNRAGTQRFLLAPAYSGAARSARIRDHAIDEFEAIVRPRLIRAASETVCQQRLVEKIAGVVSGKRPAGSVGAIAAGRQTDDHEARVGAAERWHRTVEPSGFLCFIFFAESDETRTALTFDRRLRAKNVSPRPACPP